MSFLTAALLPLTSAAVVGGPSVAAAAPKRANCPAAANDETAAARAAVACRGRVEVLADRDEKTQVFANANGSFTVQSAAVVQRVHDPAGRWVKPDPTLHRNASGRIVPAATALDLSFSGGGTGDVATIGKGRSQLALRWPGSLPAPKLTGAEATYADVLPGVDLVLTAQTEGFAEMLVVKTPKAAVDPALAAVRFTTTTTGLRLRQDAAGALTAVDDSGATLFGSGNPVMWDSSRPSGDGTIHSSRLVVPGKARRAMPVQLTGGKLVVHPDLTMLRNPATKFPVYIDPGLGKSAWTMINSAYDTQSYWSYDKQDCPSPYTSIQCAKVGYTNQPRSMIYRALFAFGISGLLNKHIQDAKLSMDTVYSYNNDDHGTQVRVTGNISSGTTWSNNASSWGAVVATANSHAYDRVRRRTEWGVTSAVRTAAAGTSKTLTLGLREVSESDVKNWKKFDAGTALLTVVYNSYPNAPDKITVAGEPCVRGSSRPYVRTLTPALKARLTDPDGTVRLLYGTFYWWNMSGGSRTGSLSVAQRSIVSGQYANATVPSGKLTDGATYAVQALAGDGIDNGQYSAICEFQVDVTAPGTPGGVTSTDYPDDGQVHGGVNSTGSFVIEPPAAVPSDFYGYAYTLDPGVSAASATQVTADATDHTATISLTPVADQTYNMRVWARDKAGNYSEPFTYTFGVRAGTGPDARWTFDGQDGVDGSTHGNTLAVTGGTFALGRGSYGQAFVGDGTSAYASTTGPITTRDPDTGTAITLHSDKSFTVAAIVRLDSAAGSGQRVILAQDGNRTSPFLLSYSVADKKWRFAVAATDADAPATAAVLSDSTAATGVWTRLFATYDGTSHALKLYVNGVLQTAAATSATFDATGPVTVGRGKTAGAPTGFFPGAIDDVRVYGRAVGSAEHEFTLVGLPNPPIVTVPGGTSAYVGRALSAVLSAGGDTAVTKIQYQLGVSGTVTTVTLPSAGGQSAVTLTGTAVGNADLLVQGIDSAGDKSPITTTTLEFAEAPALSGQVVDAVSGTPISGATVTLSPGDQTLTTGATGAYSFTGIDAGTFAVTASFGGVGCASQIATTEVDVDRAVTIDLNLAPQSDVFGYTCSTSSNMPFISGTTEVTGSQVSLPFPMPYYGVSYNKFWVTDTGFLEFINPDGEPYSPVSLPDPADAPRAAIAPFWARLYRDAAGGSIWTATVGSGSSQRFVVEWRNFGIYDFDADDWQTGARTTFEVVLAADGSVTFNYSDLSGSDYSRGSTAAVGITSRGGNFGLEYSFQQPVLSSGEAVTINYPNSPQPIQYGTLSGRVLHNGEPVPYATIELDSRYAQADASGRYEFGDMEPATYSLAFFSGCDGLREPDVAVDGDTPHDVEIRQYFDNDGYSCDLESADWIPADDPVPTDEWEIRDFGFVFPYNGRAYTQGTVGVDGLALRGSDPDDDASRVSIEVWPGRSPLTDDAGNVYTSTVGYAPNRKFVIEMRNVKSYEYPDERETYEMVFAEDGTVTTIFHDLPRILPDSPITVSRMPWDGEWTDYFDDDRGFSTGKAMVIHPPAAS